MAKREVASDYIGSFLGAIWTFVRPLVMIAVFWFVFSVGFKAKPLNDVPFVVWLTAGIAPWFVFADIINGSTTSIVGNSNLIKKTLFQSQILPVIKIVSCLMTHSVFLLILVGLIFFQQLDFNFFFLQFIYYLFGLCVFALGIAWIVSSLHVFLRDVGQLVGVILQVGFWMTPIFWDISLMSPRIQHILKFNPMYYVIQGYRDSFITFVPFWHHPVYSLYFWSVSLTVLVTGAMIFQKLKPQFADVL
jgi:lipopolysaccharide transport system permease protein/teichoic acid transport system permease protein